VIVETRLLKSNSIKINCR
jgi:hypothetical protein